jgi:hypothetical protein
VASGAEETALANRAVTQGRIAASISVINSQDRTNGPTFFDKLIDQAFNLLLNRSPLPAERTAYSNFLKTNRWEFLLVDIMANGAADLDPTLAGVQNGLPREFWEVRN